MSRKPSEFLLDKTITVAARSSPLSQKQVAEVQKGLHAFYPGIEFIPVYLQTTGDKDLSTSLRTLDKTDFFTKEIDAMLLKGECRVAIHSAKDLPDPLPEGLVIVAITKGVDPSDVLVFRDGEGMETISSKARIGSSSARRDAILRELLPDAFCVDIRGAIESRLTKLDAGDYDAIVMAEAALIRLGYTHRSRIPLPGSSAPLQGKLAVMARKGDEEMDILFSCINR